MVSYKAAIELISNIETNFYEEQINIFHDKRYIIFKNKSEEDLFNSEIADKLFEDVWLENNYDQIYSQSIANKIFEISCSLSPVIAKNIVKEVIKKLNNQNIIKKDIILQINELCNRGLEKNIVFLLRALQKKYYIQIIRKRPEESRYLALFLSKTYLS